MTRINWLLVTALLALAALPARADSTQSYVGTLADPSDDYLVLLTLTQTSDVTLQTYGFGGGTNANGTVIAPAAPIPSSDSTPAPASAPRSLTAPRSISPITLPVAPPPIPFRISATPLAATSCSPSATWPPAPTPSSFPTASSSRSRPSAPAPRSTTVFLISPAEFSATCRTWTPGPTVRILPAHSPLMSPRARHPCRPPSLRRSCFWVPAWQPRSAFASAAPSSKRAAR